jgi:RNA polymerase sigma-70 factor (ECF subfamily)
VEDRDHLYDDAIAAYGTALHRLARGYEADPDRRQDLLQQIYIAIWRSLAVLDGRCSLRTWVYRVAHNAAASHVLRRRRASSRWVSLESLEMEPGFRDGEAEAERALSLTKLLGLIANLKPLDRQPFLLYLEGETATSIAEITGLSEANVATKLHRIRKLLIKRFNEGAEHESRPR